MWYISIDKICDGSDEGQFNCNFRDGVNTLERCKKMKNKVKFRMSDDDGEIYYYGYSNDSSSFDPLDDFGMPNAGCTDIEYYEDGKWSSL